MMITRKGMARLDSLSAQRKLIRAIALCFVLVLGFPGCGDGPSASGGGDENTKEGGNAAASIVPAPQNVTNAIPKPAAGGTMATSYLTTYFGGEVTWWRQVVGDDMPVPVTETNFLKGEIYMADITLVPVAGYVFPASMEILYIFDEEKGAQGQGKFTVFGQPPSATIIFPPTTGAKLDLTGKISAPKAGQYPQTFAPASPDAKYAGPVEWYVTGSAQPYSGVFQAGQSYTAKVTLVAVNGFVFDKSTDFTYDLAKCKSVGLTQIDDDGVKFSVDINFAPAGN
jgi:hypothetical protein